MKKLLFIAILFLLVSCHDSYDAVSYTKPEVGMAHQIDSTQWDVVLMQPSTDGVQIADKRGIKKIQISDDGTTIFIVLLLLVIAAGIGASIGGERL